MSSALQLLIMANINDTLKNEESLRRLNATIDTLRVSIDSLSQKFGNIGNTTPDAIGRIASSLNGLQSSTATSTVAVQGLGAEFSTLEAEMARAIALSESGFSRMGVDIDAATKKLKEHNEELKTTAFERAKDHFNQKYMGLSKEDKDNSNPRTAGSKIGGVMEKFASDPKSAMVSGVAGLADIAGTGLADIAGTMLSPVVGEIAKSITKIGMEALFKNSEADYAARATAMSFQQNANLSSQDVSRYGESVRESELQAYYSTVASEEDVRNVYKSFAQHGAKPGEVTAYSTSGIKGFGDNVAEATLGIDKGFSASAGTSAKFAQELRQNMNVSLDESVNLLKEMGEASVNTSIGFESFVGTILQTSSSLRTQGSDTRELTSDF